MIGYKLKPPQAEYLIGVEYAPDSYFNPIKDINGVYFIFDIEQKSDVFDWLADLPQAEYVPPVIKLPI
jgi:hypothetical protein